MVKAESPGLVEMDPTWQLFLQQKVNSFIKWDLVRFFHDNPHMADTSENIAAFVGRDAEVVQHELDGLVKTNVLIAEDISGIRIYRLIEDVDVRRLISDFMAACHDREFRVQAIHHVIQVGGASQHDI